MYTIYPTIIPTNYHKKISITVINTAYNNRNSLFEVFTIFQITIMINILEEEKKLSRHYNKDIITTRADIFAK